VAEISRQFEAILVRQVLNDAQKPVFRTQIAGSGFATDVYRDLMTKELADQVTKSDNLGLARSLQTQLQHQLGSEPKSSGPADPRSVGGFDSEEKTL
jgi:Rod binding domain-containing protein